jgi:peptide-methionine (S)-S-oxide reductase
MNTPLNNPTQAVPPPLVLNRRMVLTALSMALVAGATIWQIQPSAAAEAAVVIPAPTEDMTASAGSTLETAVLAGGCFWGVQGVFQHVKGVSNAVSGYAGGNETSARYEAVGSGRTGHAEAVQISYDPRQISYGRILQIYFSVAHNPTEINRQGPDEGPQYRSTVFAQNAEQARIAGAYIAQLNKARSFGKPLVTTLEMQKRFFAAEAYHQDYLARNPGSPYIVHNDLPKIDQLKRLFPDRYREAPALVAKGG